MIADSYGVKGKAFPNTGRAFSLPNSQKHVTLILRRLIVKY
jgi:hypothetical protein